MSGAGSVPKDLSLHYSVPLVKVVLMMLFRQYNTLILLINCTVDLAEGGSSVIVTFEKSGAVFRFVVRVSDRIVKDITISHIPVPEDPVLEDEPVVHFSEWITTLGRIFERPERRTCNPPFLFAYEGPMVEDVFGKCLEALIEFSKLVDSMSNDKDVLSKQLESMCSMMRVKEISSERVFSDKFIAMVETIIATLSMV
jgi:DNA polymerase II small subunit/DNA polymerase delta subunit B